MLPLLLLAASTFALQVGAANDNTNLSPVLSPAADPSSKSNIVPSSSVTLSYGLGGSTDSLVDVSLALEYPAVLLEEVGAAAAVECTDNSVSVTFSDAGSYAKATEQWVAPFVLFTNHWGGCDTDYERGVFLASTVKADNSALTIIASTQRTDVRGVAAQTEITFSTLPIASAPRRRSHPRDITVGNDSVTISDSLALTNTKLYSYAPYFTLTADDASLDTAITLSGHLVFHVQNLTLSELSFDVNVTSSASLTLTAEVTAAFSKTFTYEPADLTYSLVNIPGILTIGPALGFAIGVELAAKGAVTATAAQTLSFADANIHFDFVNFGQTSASGWKPAYTAELNLTEAAEVEINPFVELTAELEFNILSGALDLSGGLTARPKFDNAITLAAGQVIDDNGTVSQPTSGGTCEQGAYVVSTFEFDLIAFVTQFWNDTIYSVEVPIADKCYSWL